jgi:DNA polymerase elongation subunit (family B)
VHIIKILLLDIETAPNLVYVWGIWQQNVAINQIEENGYVMCWAAKWLGEDKIMFDSVKKSGEENMLGRIHRLVEQADAIVHYNGAKFDLPTLNREWLRYGFNPPAPPKQIDLLQVCKRKFRFVSNKLDYVAQYLGLGSKMKHEGHELWTACMSGDKSAWKRMEDYNKQDVVLLEALYGRLLPWISGHPSHGAKDMINCCPKCGSENYQQRGFALTTTHKYRRYQCRDCGGWFRGTRTVIPKLEVGEERFVNVNG